MATYKKRGYKPKSVKENENEVDEAQLAAEEMDSTTADVFNTLDETANKTEEWFAANQKYIFGIVGGLAVLALLFVGYQRLIQEPKEQEAANKIYSAQAFFKQAQEASDTKKDSLYNLALNGSGGKLGFLGVIDQYAGTDSGNIAQYYAGFAFFNQKKYKEAINYLDQFSSDDYILSALAKGGIGDAFVQLNDKEQALEYYNNAAAEEENEFTTPKFLLKAAKIDIELGNAADAVKKLEKIEINYPKSNEFNEVETLLAKAKAL